MNPTQDARQLLDQLGVRNLCDLDLLVFFVRHPRTLLGSEQLVRLLGYQLKEVAQSLDGLLAAGLVTRTQHKSRAARMYVFAANGANDGSLTDVVKLASTREGRLTLRLALIHSPAGAEDGSATPAPPDTTGQAGARRFRDRRGLDTTQKAGNDAGAKGER